MSFSLKALFFGIVVLSIVLTMPSVFAESWYVGKGLKQGDYFRYNVCYIEYHNCAPIEIDFWVQNQSSTSHDYFLQMSAIDGKNIQKGIVMTTPDTLDPVYSDPNISNYSNVYKNTIIWLNALATSDSPKDFGYPFWSKLGGVFQGPQPIDQEQVTVQAGTYKAWVIGWHRGVVDNKIWVVPSMPFPVKAVVYTDVPQGIPIPQYVLELLETGNSQTQITFLNGQSTSISEVAISQSPKKQFEQGTSIDQIKCNDDLVLMQKSSDNSPACVKPSTAQKLVERGWGEFSAGTQKTDQGIWFEYHPPVCQQTPWDMWAERHFQGAWPAEYVIIEGYFQSENGITIEDARVVHNQIAIQPFSCQSPFVDGYYLLVSGSNSDKMTKLGYKTFTGSLPTNSVPIPSFTLSK